MENSELCLPFSTQADAIHSTTEDTEGFTTGEHDKTEIVPLLILCYQLRLVFHRLI